MYPSEPTGTRQIVEGAGESVAYISLPFHARPARFSATPGGWAHQMNARPARPQRPGPPSLIAPSSPQPRPVIVGNERNKINIWLRSMHYL